MINRLVIVCLESKKTLSELMENRVPNFYDLVFIDYAFGTVSINKNEKELWNSNNTVPIEQLNEKENQLLTENIDEFYLRSNELKFGSLTLFDKINLNDRYFFYLLFVFSIIVINRNNYKEVVFLSPIDNILILSFALIAKKLNLAKFIGRTGIEDKVHFSDDFIDRSIKFDIKFKETIKVNKNIDMTKSVWNDYSTYKNKKSIENLNYKFKHEYYDYITLNALKWKGIKKVGNFLYYPLHCEPGRTTQPEAGKYQNQLFNISLISSVLDENTSLILKEHPRQFDSIKSLSEFRNSSFYESVQSLPNVYYADISINSSDLVEFSQAVITATGTNGWNALVSGKPVILFGMPWFSFCYGVIFADEFLQNPEILKNFANDSKKIRNSAHQLYHYVMNHCPSYINKDAIYDYQNIQMKRNSALDLLKSLNS